MLCLKCRNSIKTPTLGESMEQKIRHLLGLSGGKDSSALAVYMRDRVPEMEYFFLTPVRNCLRLMSFWIG